MRLTGGVIIKLSKYLKMSFAIYTHVYVFNNNATSYWETNSSVLSAYKTQNETYANNTNIIFREASQELVQSIYFDILLLDVRYVAAFLFNPLYFQAFL